MLPRLARRALHHQFAFDFSYVLITALHNLCWRSYFSSFFCVFFWKLALSPALCLAQASPPSSLSLFPAPRLHHLPPSGLKFSTQCILITKCMLGSDLSASLVRTFLHVEVIHSL